VQVTDKQLIPNAFGLADGNEINLTNLCKSIKKTLESKSMNLTPAVRSACLHMLELSEQGKQNFTANKFGLTDKEYNIILKDFGELTGAAYLLSTEDKKYRAVKFPVGNEKLIDYILVTKEGFDEKFSAKAGQGGKPSVTSVMPVIEKFIRAGKLDTKFQQASWVLFHISTEEKNGLYWGPLKAANYLQTAGYKALITCLKKPNLKTGYTSGIPTEQHLDNAIAACGSYDNFMKEFKPFYDASGYTSTMNSAITKRTIEEARPGKEKRWGAIHYPITAEVIKWLNTDNNHAKELLTMAANTLTVSQVYLDTRGTSLHYTIKGFSDAEFMFGSPSSVPRPTNNRIGFTMKKSPVTKTA
jgi:hypothetical protein